MKLFLCLFLITASLAYDDDDYDYASQRPETGPGGSLMDMKLSEVIRLLKIDPGILAKAATSGNIGILEVFKNQVQGLMLGVVSVPCYADLAHFVQELYNYGHTVMNANCADMFDDHVDCDCARKLQHDTDSKAWVMNVLDATGRAQSGVFQGNLFLTGNYEQCVTLKHTKNAQGEIWEGQYCRIDISLYQNQTCSTTYVLRADTCFPASCTQQDVQRLIDRTRTYVSTAVGQTGHIDAICKIKVMCHDKHRSIANDGPALLILSIIILAGTLMMCGTLFDFYTYNPMLRTLPEKTPTDLVDSDEKQPMTQKQYADSQSWFVKMLLSFSVYSNGMKLFDTTKRPGQIHCLHGVRFLSMAWIIFGHTYYWARNYLNNLMQAYTLPPKFLNQMLLNGSLAVDAFYTISAMLLVYLFMKEAKKTKGRLIKEPAFWLMYYVHRYVRLTPLYAMILAIDATLIKYAADGPLWNQEGIEGPVCQKSWWTNLLYINNFVYLDDQCMSWSWYLANDFQFFLVSPIFLILLSWKEIVGIISIVSAIIITGIIRAAIILSHQDWPPISIFSMDERQFELVEPYWKAVYIKPYCRCGPYLVGLLLGYFFYKNQLKVNMPRWAAHLGWLLAAALGVGIVFGLYEFSNTASITSVGTAVYGGFGRTLWAIALSWVIFACATGYGGPVGAFLSWKIFIPLSKLVYAAYLLHPILIMVYYSSQQKPLHYDGHYQYVSYFIAHLLLSFFIALLLSMAFEIPVQGLENIIFGTGKKSDEKPKKMTGEREAMKIAQDNGESSALTRVDAQP